MPKQLTELPAKFCKPDCPHATLRLDPPRAYGLSHVLRCEHEQACAMWAKDGDADANKR